MNDLKIYYHINNDTKKGSVSAINYEGKMLAKFSKDTGIIDLSVLNPFVNKNADYYIIDINTYDIIHKEIIITNLELDKEIGWILHFEVLKKI